MGEIVEIDGQGRIYLPSEVRGRLRYRKFRIRVDNENIVLSPIKPAVKKYYGIAGRPIYRTPEEIDEASKHGTEKILREDLH